MDSKQEKRVDSLEIKRIDNVVHTIRLENKLQKISIDSILLSKKFNEPEFFNSSMYVKDQEIVRISVVPYRPNIAFNYSVGSSTFDFFIEENHLIFINERYTNNSRTGSCGAIEIENKLYYKKDTLVGTSKNERCYNTPIEVDGLYDIFKKIYTLSKEKI